MHAEQSAEALLERLAATLRAWLPGSAQVAAALADAGLPLHAAEAALVAKAVEPRRAEFAAGRYSAHRCLERLGAPPQPILADARGAPCWPQGVCGSITHESGLALAAAVGGAEAGPIGIDLFDTRRAADMASLAPLFLSEAERLRVRDDLQRMILFCAKESAVKAFSARAVGFLEFAALEVETDGAGFVAVAAGSGLRARGRWALVDPFLLSLARM